MLTVSKAKPEEVFNFVEAAAALGPCTIEQVRGQLRAQWPPVRSAKTFADQYGLIASSGGRIRVTTLAERLLHYTGTKRVEFILRHWRLQDYEPFRYLRTQLASRSNGARAVDLAELVRIKFLAEARWGTEDRRAYGEALVAWMQLLRLVEMKGGSVEYVGGTVVTPSVLSLLEVEFLRQRELRDWFVENLESPRQVVDDCRFMLEHVAKEADDEKRGKLFPRFVAEAARRFGFSPRTRNSPYESAQKVSFEENKGGGDVVLYFHHPVESSSGTFQGCAIACEAKSTEGNVGSKAVGQARNLAAKIREAYPEYVVFPVIVSRSKVGLDPSGVELAPPDVFHLSADCLLALLEHQRELLIGGKPLILPSRVLQLLDGMMKDEILQPAPEELIQRVLKLP